MIRNRDQKINRIINRIRGGIDEINRRYRTGPDLYFYRRLLGLRGQALSLSSFLHSDYNIEVLYATLVAWDMNSRAAKMLYFDEFKQNIFSSINRLEELDTLFQGQLVTYDAIPILRAVYSDLKVMKGHAKLVSNSKVLHFLFPANLMPMDGTNTLQFFYGNTGESMNKYMEVVKLTFEIMERAGNWQNYLDDKWNTTVPKMIDNAILLLEDRSLRE